MEATEDDLFEEAIFNTTVNLYVPLFGVALPAQTAAGQSLNLAYQLAFIGLGLLAAVTYIAVPSGMAIAQAATNHQGDSKFMRSVTSRNGGGLGLVLDKIGLNWEQCLKKTICEAHQRSGLVSLAFTMFYPPPYSEIDEDNNNADPYQLAARYGLRKTRCGTRYTCLLDVLDIINYSIQALLSSVS